MVLTASPGSNGIAEVEFPEAVGTDPTDLPHVACYRQNPDTGSWWVVGDGFHVDAPWCMVVFEQQRWRGVMFNLPSGWTAAFVVVY